MYTFRGDMCSDMVPYWRKKALIPRGYDALLDKMLGNDHIKLDNRDLALRPVVFEIQSCRKSEMHRMTIEWPWALSCQKYLYTLNTHIWGPNPTLRPAVFDIHGFRNWKCTEWPQNDLNHLTVKITMYTLNTHPRGPNFTSFSSTD